MPAVTVVIPTRGVAPFLPLALASALHQRDVDLEVVVVDDGSEREGGVWLGDLEDPRIRGIRHDRPRGVSAARNTGIAAAAGEWMAFLDDDDIWSPEKLGRQLSAVRSSGRRWVYAGAVAIDVDNRVLYVEPVLEPDRLLKRLPALNVVPTSNVMVHRELLSQASPFDTALRLTEDWDLYLRLARVGPPAFVPDHLVAFRTHPAQSSLDPTGLLAEIETFERRHGVRTDRVAILRGAAWSCLRAGDRRAALGLYRHAIGQGDLSSVARAVLTLAPGSVQARIMSRAAPGSRSALGEDQRWVDGVVRASL
ncbi:MAG: glycosyltransferase family 2 protein [Actinomycetota bacterium]|nr:glycosyltransferase family 2 protein [Actinomycetota bacterium]